jgi:hypothetical protein
MLFSVGGGGGVSGLLAGTQGKQPYSINLKESDPCIELIFWYQKSKFDIRRYLC